MESESQVDGIKGIGGNKTSVRVLFFAAVETVAKGSIETETFEEVDCDTDGGRYISDSFLGDVLISGAGFESEVGMHSLLWEEDVACIGESGNEEPVLDVNI